MDSGGGWGDRWGGEWSAGRWPAVKWYGAPPPLAEPPPAATTVPQIASRWLLQKGDLPRPKATSSAYIRANAELDSTLSKAGVATLDALRDLVERTSGE